MDAERHAIVHARLIKPESKIATAQADLAAARYDDAASRAYYAMFHTTRALLAAKGLNARTHSGLAAVFAEHFVRTGELDAEFGRWIGQGRRTREVGDYDDFLTVEADEATEVVTRATRFLDEARRWLSGQGYT